MVGYIVICVVAVAVAVSLIWKTLNKREKKLLDKLEQMIESARGGNFDVTKIDETMLSSVENSMSRFLDDCSVSERNLKEQKDKIQTLLHMLGGLDKPTEGSVTVDGNELSQMLLTKWSFKIKNVLGRSLTTANMS